MNKKILVFIALTVSLLSIVLIAIFGTLPEANTNIRLEQIEFLDYDEVNEDGDKFMNLYGIITVESPTISLKYELIPGDANNQLQVLSSMDRVHVYLDPMNQKILVVFDFEALGQTVTITLTDRNTAVKDEITLWFKSSGPIIID